MSIDITLDTPTVDACRRPRHPQQTTPHAAPTRREPITALMKGEPPRPWSGRELADYLGIKPRNMLTQPAERTRLGLLTRTSTGTYALPDPPRHRRS